MWESNPCSQIEINTVSIYIGSGALVDTSHVRLLLNLVANTVHVRSVRAITTTLQLTALLLLLSGFVAIATHAARHAFDMSL